MSPSPPHRRTRRGFSLLELTAAAALTASLMAGSMIVIRTSHAAWLAHEGDLVQSASAEAVVRHISRAVRQAESVVSITASSNTAGKLELLDIDGNVNSWAHTGTADGIVEYNAAGALLAEGIDELSFAGYEADGATLAGAPTEVQMVKVTAKVTLPRGGGQTRTVTCCCWVRSW
ncbi:MAG: hypothetical protein AAGJ46_10960 [Planctomycetota bacterium]